MYCLIQSTDNYKIYLVYSKLNFKAEFESYLHN